LLLVAGGALILAGASILLIPGVHAGELPSDPGTLKLAQLLTSAVLFGVPSLLYALMTFRREPLQELGFRSAERSSFYWIPMFLLLISIPLEGWLGMINKQLPLPHWMHDLEHSKDQQITLLLAGKRPIDLVTNLVVMAIVPGIVEEACFRGALQRVLINLFRSPWAGIVVTGLIFSACHGEFEGFLPRAVLGILLGAAFWYSKSLWPVVIAHVVFNGIQVIAAAWYPDMVTENPSVPVYWALLSLVLVVGLLAYMRKRSTVTYAQIYPAGRTGEK
jgi:membrane protease YdiL (CAAX protease family)